LQAQFLLMMPMPMPSSSVDRADVEPKQATGHPLEAPGLSALHSPPSHTIEAVAGNAPAALDPSGSLGPQDPNVTPLAPAQTSDEDHNKPEGSALIGKGISYVCCRCL
jgi:hypothetical protein